MMMRILKQACVFAAFASWVRAASFNLDLTDQEHNTLKSHVVLSQRLGIHSQIALMMDKLQAMMLLGESILTKEDFDKINNDVIIPQTTDLHAQFQNLSTDLNKTIADNYDIDFDTFAIQSALGSLKQSGKKVETTNISWGQAIEAEKKALGVAMTYQAKLEVNPCTTVKLSAQAATNVASFLASCNLSFVSLATEFSDTWTPWDELRPLTEQAKEAFNDARKNFKTSFCGEFNKISELIEAYEKSWESAQGSSADAIAQAEGTHAGITAEDTGLKVVHCLLEALQLDLSADQVASRSDSCMTEEKSDMPGLTYPTSFTKKETSGTAQELQDIWRTYNYQETQQSALEACEASAK